MKQLVEWWWHAVGAGTYVLVVVLLAIFFGPAWLACSEWRARRGCEERRCDLLIWVWWLTAFLVAWQQGWFA